jgi:hypothetical protein
VAVGYQPGRHHEIDQIWLNHLTIVAWVLNRAARTEGVDDEPQSSRATVCPARDG